LVEPDYNDERLVSAVWYCDGSLLHGKWLQYRSTGFGIVVATSDGDLLGYGHGAPPHWCSTAAAVETWAIQTILSFCPFPPQMRTDCQSILKIAVEGSAKATHASRQLARLWIRIDAILEQDVACLVHTGVLVWMPAHLSHNMVGEVKLSNGVRLSTVDWRANRLADALAKSVAARNQMPTNVARVLDGAAALVRHSVILLAHATHLANNHIVQDVGLDGEIVKRVLRDAVPKPVGRHGEPRKPVGTQPVAATTIVRDVSNVKPWTPPTMPSVRQRVGAVRRAFSSRRAAEQDGFLSRRVEALAATLTSSMPVGSASARRAELLQRVRERASSC